MDIMIGDKIYLIQEIERELALALIDCRKKGKELINSALERLEELKKLMSDKDK